MEAVVFMGLQASGKSSLYHQRFFATHVRLNLDMLKTRDREWHLMQACLRTGQRFVVDNTNPTRQDRQRYIVAAREHGFRLVGYYFQSQIEACKERNENRAEAARVPLPGLLGTYARLELPSLDEGFDELFYVSLAKGGFAVEGWQDEV